MRTKHSILSVLVVLAIVASLFVIVAPTASADVTGVTVVATPATAGDVAGYTISSVAGNIAAAGTINITFPSAVVLPASISYTMIAVGGVALSALDSVSISGQSIIITKNAGGAVSPVVISQGAGIKNPAVAKTAASHAYPVTVVTSADGAGVPPTNIGYLGVIPSYAISVSAGPRANSVTVTGKGWNPNSSITIGGGLTNSSTGGITAADGSFSVTAYPALGGAVTVTDGAGQTELYKAGVRTPALVITTPWDGTVAARSFTILPSLTVTPASGNIGSIITIQGVDFTVQGNILINNLTMAGTGLTLVAPSVYPIQMTTIDAFGTNDDFQVKAYVPGAMPAGAKVVLAADDGGKTGSGTFTVAGPTIALSPMTGQPNTLVTITGTNFVAGDTIGTTGLNVAPGSPITGIFWDQPSATNLTPWNTSVITINASGSFSVTLKVPANAVNGLNPVVAMTTGGTVASYGFFVGAREATLTPSSGPMGTTVVLTATNMTPLATITGANIILGAAAWNGAPASTTTDSLGNFPATTLKIAKGFATGPLSVSITDPGPDGNYATLTDNVMAVGTFTITQPTITITPTTAYKGDTIVVNGSGWVPGMLGLAVISFNTNITVLATPDAAGAFTASFTVPATALASNTVTAADNYLNGPPAVTFTLAPASISISPTSGPVGTDVTVTGKGFLPQAGLSALTIGGVPEMPATSVVTDEIGAFTATFTVPGLAVGAQTVSATVGGFPVTAFFTITSAGASAKVHLKSISAQLVRVWGYSNGTWQMYDPADAIGSDLATLVAGAGYFVNVNAPCTLVYGGNSTNLVAGWNLIGWR